MSLTIEGGLKGLVVLLLGALGVQGWMLSSERAAWREFAALHDCKPVEFKRTTITVAVGPFERDQVDPGGVRWLCADGSEVWRGFEPEATALLPKLQ